jgi:hypothetical protein
MASLLLGSAAMWEGKYELDRSKFTTTEVSPVQFCSGDRRKQPKKLLKEAVLPTYPSGHPLVAE